MPAHPEYDPEATSLAIQQSGGSHLDPLTMIHQDVQTAFKIIGKNQDKAETVAKIQASLKTEVANLKESVSTLQNRLWGLACGIVVLIGEVGLSWFLG